MDSPNTKISSGNWSLIVVCKFIAERIITCQCTNENPGNSLTKRDFRLQSGNLVYKMRFSFTKRDSWVTNGTLALHFTLCVPVEKRSLHFYLTVYLCGVSVYQLRIASVASQVYTCWLFLPWYRWGIFWSVLWGLCWLRKVYGCRILFPENRRGMPDNYFANGVFC